MEYTADRWLYQATQTGKGTWQRITGTGPPGNFGFNYALGFTSSSAYAVTASDTFIFTQPIEADMVSDFAWGNASAQPVTLSFWAYCTLGGTFGGCIKNNVPNRSYPFTYSLSASTWTKVVITIPGDTSGTWVMYGNGAGAYLAFDLGTGTNQRGPANAWASSNYQGATGAVSVVGTNGATFYVTGVKLEIGSVATPYNRQSLAKSMADCQRYYIQGPNIVFQGQVTSGSNYGMMTQFAPMRATPTVTTSYISGSIFPAANPATAQFIATAGFLLKATANGTSPSGYFAASYAASAEL